MGTRTQAARPDALVEALVEVALQRAWLHDDPASYRAGVLSLRDALRGAGATHADEARPLDATG